MTIQHTSSVWVACCWEQVSRLWQTDHLRRVLYAGTITSGYSSYPWVQPLASPLRLEFVSPPVRNYLEAGGSQILSFRLTWRGKQQMMSLSFFSHCQSICQRPEARNFVFTKSCKALATIRVDSSSRWPESSWISELCSLCYTWIWKLTNLQPINELCSSWSLQILLTLRCY